MFIPELETLVCKAMFSRSASAADFSVLTVVDLPRSFNP